MKLSTNHTKKSAIVLLALVSLILTPVFAFADAPPPIDSSLPGMNGTQDSSQSSSFNGTQAPSAGGNSSAPAIGAGGNSSVPIISAGGNSSAPVIGAGGNSSSGSGDVFKISNPLHATSIGEIVLDLVQVFSYIVVLLAVLMLIWLGFQYILAGAQGDAEKIKNLHGYLLWIVVGVAVVIGARVIVQVVINTLEATGTVNQTVLNSAKKAAQGQ